MSQFELLLYFQLLFVLFKSMHMRASALLQIYVALWTVDYAVAWYKLLSTSKKGVVRHYMILFCFKLCILDL